MGLKIGRTLPVDRVATCSFCTGIEGGSDSDWVPDPYPPSDPGGLDFADSSSKSSSSMGGVDGFVFRLAGGQDEDGDGASQLGCWGGGVVCRNGGGGGGSALGG